MEKLEQDSSNPLKSLALKISEYAKRHQLLNDAYLIGLIKALVNNHNLHVWAEINPFENFPRAAAKKHELITNITKVLTIVRNVAVFIPIAVIWRAVGEATTQFEIYVTENSGAITNFLTFWQNGYGYLENEYTIGHVAFVDFLIIVGIIVLTFILNITDAIANSIKEKEEALLDKDRDALCLELMQELSAFRKVDSQALEKTFLRAISQMNETISDLKAIVSSEISSSKTLSQNVDAISQQQSQWSKIQFPEFERFNLALAELTKSLQELNAISGQKLPKSLENTLAQVESTASGLKNTNIEINKNTKELLQEISRLKTRLTRIKKTPKK